MADEHVLLLSMPWEQLEYPSIQLGILLSVLEKAGIPAQARSLNLDFMEHCAAGNGSATGGRRLSVTPTTRWSCGRAM